MHRNDLRLLVIEDNPDDAFLLVRELTRAGYAVGHRVVDTEYEVREALASQEWDCVTSDHKMPFFSAPEAVKTVRELAPDIPLVIVSGEMDLDLAVSLLKSGADDYVQKKDLPLVVKAIESAIERSKARQAQRREKTHAQEREKLLRCYFDLPLVGAMILGNNYQIIEVNQTLCDLLRYERDHLINSSACQLVSPKDINVICDQIAMINDQNSSTINVNVELLDHVKSPVSVKISGNWISNSINEEGYVLLLVIDQTQNCMLAKLAEERKRLLSAIDRNSPYAIYLFDVKTLGFRYVNKRAEEMFGYSQLELIEMGPEVWKQLADPEDLSEFDHYQKVMSTLADNVSISSHFKIRNRNGVRHHFICHESVFERNELGEPVLVFGIQSDITGIIPS